MRKRNKRATRVNINGSRIALRDVAEIYNVPLTTLRARYNRPEGYVGLLTSRSGVSSKTHLVIETGKIDAGYQGNMKINIKNDAQDFEASRNSTEEEGALNYDIKGELKNKIIYQSEYQHNKNKRYVIRRGDKLAQLVIVPIWTPELKEVEEFSYVSERGTDGFGSTGY